MEMISWKNLKNHTFAVIFNKTRDFEIIFIERNYYGTATQQDHQTSSPQSLSGSYPRTRQSADRRQISVGQRKAV